LLALTALPPAQAFADTDLQEPAQDLTTLSIEDLMHLRVTSVSKKDQMLANVAAAIFVITSEDIRRSGVTSLPEALRMAPGLDVARVNANKWAVTSRGFNGTFANKLLVLIDGRSLYTPFFAGVNWDMQDVLLEDVDRIEVIRGPGAAIWGANAVNGVINIITKSADDTTGTLVSAGGGTFERGFGALRYGANVGKDSAVRVYGKYQNRDNSVLSSTGAEGSGAWETLSGGFRLDSSLNARDSFTLQGDVNAGSLDDTLSSTTLRPLAAKTITPVTTFFDSNLLARFQRKFSDDSDAYLQLYYDRTRRYMTIVDESRDTVDLEFHHRFPLGERQEIIWGGGYRFFADAFANKGQGITLSPDARDSHIYSGLLQDDVTLFPELLHLILGTKLEHNRDSGLELQPSARLLWTPNPHNSVWAAVSRAVRTPSRVDTTVRLDADVLPPAAAGRPSTLLSIVGSTAFKAEELLAYEAGYRSELSDSVSVDLAVFYNQYHRLRSNSAPAIIPASPLGNPYNTALLTAVNSVNAESYGVELTGEWRATEWWKLKGAYSFIRLHAEGQNGDQAAAGYEGNAPAHQFSVRSMVDLGRNVSFDLWGRYADSISITQASVSNLQIPIPAYFTLEARLAWRPVPGLELSLVGQNLIDQRHSEFKSELTKVRYDVERGFYGKLTWQF
jgi:iron complex outermembrane receptor protein